MSQKLLAMPCKGQKPFDSCYGGGDIGITVSTRAIKKAARAKWNHSRKVFVHGLLVGVAMFCGKVDGESVEIYGYISAPAIDTPLLFKLTKLTSEMSLYGVGNSIELLSPIPASGKLMPEPDAKQEGNDSPSKGDGGLNGLEERDYVTQKATHDLREFLLTQLAALFVMFPLGAYIGMRQELRRAWKEHTPKGYLLKVPTLAILSITAIPMRIKSRRWQIWEQRQWFRDMKVCHGVAVAYRDAWYWKKLVAERWQS
ncbi:hypothetical protein ABRP56_09095 [Pectobacterium odoriferum]|uniref:hypothetical protein n=1 Tax=Pectobacterium odoriferum TaxID=78398 RepID=UPI0032EC3C11